MMQMLGRRKIHFMRRGIMISHLFQDQRKNKTPSITSSQFHCLAPSAMDISFYNINYSVLTKKEFKSSLGLKNSSLSSANKNLTIRERVSEFLKKPLFPDKSPPEHTQILSNVSGHLQKGSMLAILGSSGCGKTTILNVLSGRIKMSSTFYSHANHTDTLTGGIYFNGKPAANSSIGNSKIGVKERRMDLKKTPKNPKPNLLLKYVHQDDAFLPFLTVRETLEYSYALKRHVPLKSVPQKAITAILTQLRLLKVADNKVGNALQRGISGGERRRLSIGVELVTEPQMLFLDEPTSGLDSVNAVRVVEVIKSLTIDNKCTVFMSIHQPSSTLFHLFDQLLLLDKGRVVYLGPALASM